MVRPLVLVGWLVCVAAVAAAAAPVVSQNDYAPARAAAAALPRLHGLLVSHRGQLVLEYYAKGHSAGRLANIKSASKSIIADARRHRHRAQADRRRSRTDRPLVPRAAEGRQTRAGRRSRSRIC